MLTYEYAKEPIFSSEDGTKINLVVKFDHLPQECPFTADSNDVEEHSKELHGLALSGAFGEVMAYIQPPISDSGLATQPQPTTTGSQTL